MEGNVCQTCLSRHRRLFPMASLIKLLQESNVIREIKTLEGGVCWECLGLLKKFSNFKKQIKKAQHLLMFSIPVQNSDSLSHLSMDTKRNYDYQFNYSDPLTNVDENVIKIKVEPEPSYDDAELLVETKVEYLEGDDFNDDSVNELIDSYKLNFNNVDTEIAIEPFDCEVKKETDDVNKSCVTILKPSTKLMSQEVNNVIDKSIKDVRFNKDRIKELEGMYSVHVFSVEEMLKNREEKRNNPNYKKLPLKCDSCVLGFFRKDTFNNHMEKKHSESAGKFICDVCNTRFSSHNSIARHCWKHFKLYKCKLCSHETAEYWAIMKHCGQRHRDDSLQEIHCRKCQWAANHETAEYWAIMKHCGQRHRDDSLQEIHCRKCQWASKTPEELKEHNKTKHCMFCDVCGDKFSQANTLRKHKNRIHGIMRDMVCDICHRTFVNKQRLETHMAAHDASIAASLSYCAKCKVQYKSVNVYRQHLKNHTTHTDTIYRCTECDRKFASKGYFRTHYKFYHLKKSEHKCDLCNKLFLSDSRLNDHNRIRHGLARSRDHACDKCDKKFFTRGVLLSHRLVHSPARTFMCSHCGDTFKQRAALYTHNRLVHVGKKQTCDK